MSKESELLEKLLNYSDRYDINFQMFYKNYSIYIERDGVPLWDYVGAKDPVEVMEKALEYFRDIRKMKKKNI